MIFSENRFPLFGIMLSKRRLSMDRLRRRAEFLAVAAGAKAPATTFVLQARRRADEAAARVGFTVSKKVGGAVERNRVRRRLKEAVRRSAAIGMRAGHDYVVVGRRAALRQPFALLIGDIEQALIRVHAKPAALEPPAAERAVQPTKDRQ